ncbi:MAG: PHP domain-containing protein [Clostridia bacterium]|nr:PHP domain-containing protein [Clostridia bacterium]
MIDLHIHTNYSDGTDSLKELLQKAEIKKLEVISITDHDTIDSYYELEKNKELRDIYNGEIIIGAELKTFYKDVTIEVLAYGADYKKLRINKVDQEKTQKEFMTQFKEILDKQGFKYNPENLYIDKNDPTKQYASWVVATEILKHPENDDLIRKLGEFTPESFFRIHQCNKNSIFYINENKYSIDLNETISRIHEAGGLAFLAHGYIYPFGNNDEIIEEILKTTEIDGIEVEYPSFSDEQRIKAKALAKKYNKFVSGGTDYHAKNKPHIELGTGIQNNINISKDFINEWINKVRKI